MELEKAIQHCIEVAKRNRTEAPDYNSDDDYEAYLQKQCIECAKKNEQLAKWLNELKLYKEDKHSCQCCVFQDKSRSDHPCNTCRHNFNDNFEWRGEENDT